MIRVQVIPGGKVGLKSGHGVVVGGRCSNYDVVPFEESVSLVARKEEFKGLCSDDDSAAQDDLAVVLQVLLVWPGQLTQLKEAVKAGVEDGKEKVVIVCASGVGICGFEVAEFGPCEWVFSCCGRPLGLFAAL
jgi:hypothetical protein